MAKDTKKSPPAIPPMNPYVFTVLILAFGLYCIYDGFIYQFISDEPKMKDWEVLMNQIAGVLLVIWGVYDFIKVRKRQKKAKESEE